MPLEITTVTLRSRLYDVNCYLVRSDTGSVLIDTGLSTRRADLERQLEAAGCRPGDLRLIVITQETPTTRATAPTFATHMARGSPCTAPNGRRSRAATCA